MSLSNYSDEVIACVNARPNAKDEKILEAFDGSHGGTHTVALNAAWAMRRFKVPDEEIRLNVEDIYTLGYGKELGRTQAKEAMDKLNGSKEFEERSPANPKLEKLSPEEKEVMTEKLTGLMLKDYSLAESPVELPETVKGTLELLYEDKTTLVHMTTENESQGETKPLSKWLEMPEEDLEKYQLRIASPLKDTSFDRGGKTMYRCTELCEDVQSIITFEIDNLPDLELWEVREIQLAIIAHIALYLPLVSVCWSGGKSMHATFSLLGLSARQIGDVKRYMRMIGGDHKAFNIVRLCRTPNATRHENGNKQTLLYLDPDALTRKAGDVSAISLRDPNESAAVGGVFPLKHLSEMTFSTEANDFVEGLLTTGGVSVVYGESNSGKSFWALSLAAGVASGTDWRDKEVERGGVIYLCLEGERGIQNRIELLKRKNHLSNSDPFHILPVPVNFLHGEDREKLVATVVGLAKEANIPVRLVIVDTLSRAMPGGNENGVEDMTELIATVDAVKNETEAHVMLIHHCGKIAAKGARGHSSLRAAVDTEIELIHDKKHNISVATVTKQRDLEGGDVFPFKLDVVGLGEDDKGRAITSCLVEHRDKSEAPTISRGRKPRYRATDLLDLLPRDNITLWKKEANEELGVSRSTFYELKKELNEGSDYLKKPDGSVIDSRESF